MPFGALSLSPLFRSGSAARGGRTIRNLLLTISIGGMSCLNAPVNLWAENWLDTISQRIEKVSIREQTSSRQTDKTREPEEQERPQRLRYFERTADYNSEPGAGFMALTQMLEEETGIARTGYEDELSTPPLLIQIPKPNQGQEEVPAATVADARTSSSKLDEIRTAPTIGGQRDPAEVALQIQLPSDQELFEAPPLEEPYYPGDPYLYDEPIIVKETISPYKSGFFQKLSLTGTWLANGRDVDDLGITELEAYVTVALPAPIVEWPLLITPAFNIRLFQGPRITDLPPRLYDTYVDFMWVPQFTSRLKALLAVTPSYYSDFQQSDSGAFRVQGKAFGIYDYNPGKLQIVAGVLYLDRDDVVILPAGGVIWTPADWARYELLFPQPKLMTRFNMGPGFEDWVYFTSQWGGSTYSIERLSGTQDRVTWTDFRLLLGVERKLNGGAGYRLEGGYVFGRQVSYASGNGDFDPSPTWLVRGGITF